MVLLRNYNLKERPVSPMGASGHPAPGSTVQIPLSPLQSNDSPNTNQAQQNIAQPTQQQMVALRNQTPQNIASVNQQPAPPMSGSIPGRGVFNPQIAAPPNYIPPGMGPRLPPRWMLPPQQRFIVPGAASQPNTQTSSALIAQLTQPPSVLGPNVNQFGQRMDGGSSFSTSSEYLNPYSIILSRKFDLRSF